MLRDGAGGAFLCACTGVWLTGFECSGVGGGGGHFSVHMLLCMYRCVISR